jgi:transcriptional regulator with XRE-family HTH domain
MKERIYSNRIKVLLQQKNMTQQELADKVINGNRAHISRIVTGRLSNITLRLAFKIADALDKRLEEVFIYRGKNEKKED